MPLFKVFVTVITCCFVAAWASPALLLPGEGQACSTPHGNGTCLATSLCLLGTSQAGYCAGSSDIQCCVRACETPFGQGFCQATIRNCTGGGYVQGHCPGDLNTQCCVASCTTDTGIGGSCLWTGSPCVNSYVVNRCPGATDIMCCPNGSGSSNGTSSPLSNSPSSSSTSGSPGHGLSTGAVVGVVVAGLVCVAAIAALATWFIMGNKDGKDGPTTRSFSGPVAWRGPEMDGASKPPDSLESPISTAPRNENPVPPTSQVLELEGQGVVEMRGHKD